MLAPRCFASSTNCLQAEKLASLSGVAVTWHTAATGWGEVDILHGEQVIIISRAEKLYSKQTCQVNYGWSLTALAIMLAEYFGFIMPPWWSYRDLDIFWLPAVNFTFKQILFTCNMCKICTQRLLLLLLKCHQVLMLWIPALLSMFAGLYCQKSLNHLNTIQDLYHRSCV